MNRRTFAPGAGRLGYAVASALASTIILVAGCAQQGEITPGGGVNVGDASALRNLVPAEQLEQASSQQYTQLIAETSTKGALAKDSDKQLKRLRRIADKLKPVAPRFNARAAQWQWEVNLIKSDQINAFCMPGGKIAFYTGIIDKLKLTDDEIGVIMGHEMAHALREHGREQIAKQGLTQIGTAVAESAVTSTAGATAGSLVKQGAGLLSLKFSRDDETDADLVGLELAARAGFDPKAGVTLWKKMAAANKGAPMEWFSTHPSSDSRIATIEKNLIAVEPLYKEAKAAEKKG
ncbi:MAG: M48 family metallopeptidase [Hyphomicrobium sp.]|nr:M48 family metallopeptidase [Hyphomicrobium sp.]